jgi:hypothetical protein
VLGRHRQESALSRLITRIKVEDGARHVFTLQPTRLHVVTPRLTLITGRSIIDARVAGKNIRSNQPVTHTPDEPGLGTAIPSSPVPRLNLDCRGGPVSNLDYARRGQEKTISLPYSAQMKAVGPYYGRVDTVPGCAARSPGHL